MQPQLTEATRRAVLALAVQSALPARLAMRGRSMAPFLREGMTLEVGAAGALKRGEIAVFRSGDRIVAHRVVDVREDIVVCAGDAQPDSLEYVSSEDIIGKVTAYAGDGASSRSLESFALRAYGVALARTRSLRAFWRRAHPGLRAPVYRTLTEALSAHICGDMSAFVRTIESVPPWKLAAVARRHRCAALLCAATDGIDSPYAVALATLLRRDRWATAVVSQGIRAQVLSVSKVLQTAGIPAVLLKGAARMFRRDPGWEYLDACDIDILVAESHLNAAASALASRGYAPGAGADESFYARHQHIAPLHPKVGVPVEIHRSLVRSDRADRPWTLDDLRPFLTGVCDGGARALTLDRAGTALHLALHGIRRPVLRDIVLLAGVLREMNDVERRALREAIESERREGVRLQANVAFAARIGGVPWDTPPEVDRFVHWSIEREDLPRPLRSYPECFDAWLWAPRGRRLGALWAAALAGPPRRRVSRAIIRAGCAPAIALYRMVRRRSLRRT